MTGRATYGTPGQLASLLDSIARTVEGEPDDVFTDVAVQNAAHDLAGVLTRRLIETVTGAD